MSVEQRARDWLLERGADSIEHAGGSLYAHLGRVHDRLTALGLDEELQLAGLTHAVYSTDGFAVALLDVAARAELRELVGSQAEQIVYCYAGCDRGRTWRALGQTRIVWSRFNGESESPTPAELRAFVDLSIVNELDVVGQDPAIAEKHGPYFRTTFDSWAELASPAVIADARKVLAF
jgi:hypothetical protein